MSNEEFVSQFYKESDEAFISRFLEWDGKMCLSKEDWSVIAPRMIEFYDKKIAGTENTIDKRIWLILQRTCTMLTIADADNLKTVWIDNYNELIK